MNRCSGANIAWFASSASPPSSFTGFTFRSPFFANLPKTAHTEPVKLKRNTGFAEEEAREERFAKLLRLRSPYTLDKAEEHYKALVQLEHPDANENSPESNAAAAELNEAIAFFRDRLG